MKPNIQYFEPEELLDFCTEKIISCLKTALTNSNEVGMVLAGGSSYQKIYQKIAHEHGNTLNWSRVHLFFGDERMVSQSDINSNYLSIQKAWLQQLQGNNKPIIHPFLTHLSPNEVVKNYDAEIKKFKKEGGVFALALLGVGSDGHTASLFPLAKSTWESTDQLVLAVEAEQAPFISRITLTPAFFEQVLEIIFVISGEGKQLIAQSIKENKEDEYPFLDIKIASGNIYYLVDRTLFDNWKRPSQNK